MSATRTFLEMRTRARQLADMENSEFVSEDELKDIVNEQIAELWDILIEARGSEYFRKEMPLFQTVVGQTKYLLPEDYYRLTQVAAGIGSDIRRLRRFEENDLPSLLNLETSGTWDVYGTWYCPVGKYLELRPTPKSAFDVRLFYLPVAPRLENDLDEFDGINGWETWVETSAAIVMLDKEESDSSALQIKLARLEGRIRKLAPSRDEASPLRITDTARDGIYNPYFDDWNR